MRLPFRPGTVLLDFDGVLSHNASGLLLRALHRGLNRHTPVPLETTTLLFKAIVTFPMRSGLGLVFDGLGLSAHFAEESTAIWAATAVDGRPFTLAAGAERFCTGRRSGGTALRVCSTMDAATPRRALVDDLFGDADFLPIGHRSKADAATFAALREELADELPQPWLLVDDSPLALRAAKVAGLTTVMMLNSVFTAADVAPYAPFVDATVSSFDELDALIGNPHPFESSEVSHELSHSR